MKKCLECDDVAKAKGFCKKHYNKKYYSHGGLRVRKVKLDSEQQKEDLWQFVKKQLNIK